MRGKKGIQTQFEIMVDFMERNGDISKPSPGSQGRLDNLQKWLELADLLNKSRGEPRPLEKWRKAWSDLKNNTKRKVKKIKSQGGDGPELTDVEKKLMKLLREQSILKRKILESDEDNEIIFKEEIEPDPCTRTLSPPPQYFCAVNGTASRRRKSTSSFASEGSSATSEKRKKPLNDEIKEVTDRYFEFEREREKLAHEREMARIKQNEQLISIFGRMVNVLESLTPSLQRYLNRNSNEGG